MSRSTPLPFDPIDEAARHWAQRWDATDEMAAVTSIMRVQQLLLAAIDNELRPWKLSFARYEALVLLTFSRRGSLPMSKMGERLLVHPTTVTSIVGRLEKQQYVSRAPHPTDGRTTLINITARGRRVVAEATEALVAVRFNLAGLSGTELSGLYDTLRAIRLDAGDFSEPASPIARGAVRAR